MERTLERVVLPIGSIAESHLLRFGEERLKLADEVHKTIIIPGHAAAGTNPSAVDPANNKPDAGCAR